MPERLEMKKSDEESLHRLYLDVEEVPWPKGMGREKAEEVRSKLCFCLAVNKGT
jgi:hypothetical protein